LPSPTQKRSRSRSPEAENHGSIAEKRLKTDHHELDHRDVDLSAANWDISAMIENALGSLDQQPHQPHTDHHHGTEHGLGQRLFDTKRQPLKKTEQKRMTFSSNPYYVMRTMSLPLLGSLVSTRRFYTGSSFMSLIGVSAGYSNTARPFAAIPGRDFGAHG
jgi:hypothetical protein